MTEDEKNRKQIVHSKIFYYEQMTPLQMNLVIYILRDFKKYVLLFQLEKPQVHVLHYEQVVLVQRYLGHFVKHFVLIKHKSGRKLSKLNLHDSKICMLASSLVLDKFSFLLLYYYRDSRGPSHSHKLSYFKGRKNTSFSPLKIFYTIRKVFDSWEIIKESSYKQRKNFLIT